MRIAIGSTVECYVAALALCFGLFAHLCLIFFLYNISDAFKEQQG